MKKRGGGAWVRGNVKNKPDVGMKSENNRTSGTFVTAEQKKSVLGGGTPQKVRTSVGKVRIRCREG